VSITVVDNQSTGAARGSPVADPIPEPAPTPAGILGAPTDESAGDTAVAAVEADPDLEASPDLDADPDLTGEEAGEVEEAEQAEVFDSSPNGTKPGPAPGIFRARTTETWARAVNLSPGTGVLQT